MNKFWIENKPENMFGICFLYYLLSTKEGLEGRL